MPSIFAFELGMEEMVSSHGVMRLVLPNEGLFEEMEGVEVISSLSLIQISIRSVISAISKKLPLKMVNVEAQNV
jgi:hypothetical protein